MDYIALTLPSGKQVNAPGQLPSGGLDTLSGAISVGVSWMVIITIFLTLIFLVWGGAQWSASGGDKSKIAAARAKITYAIIGLIVAISAFFIVSLFGNFFGVDIFAN